MHRHIIAHRDYIGPENISELAGMSFVFICIDKSGPKEVIIRFLLDNKIPFVDTGMGVERVDSGLTGILRVTTGTPDKSDHLADRISFFDPAQDEYPTNVQIAELNALSAALAVIKWKKIFGFYADRGKEHHSTFALNNGEIHHGDHCTQVCQAYSGENG